MTHPLILVFYIDRRTMQTPEIIREFVNSVNTIIDVKKMNAVAFFLPTDAEERLECINPAVVPADEMGRINNIVLEIKKQFNVGDDV